jgi:regulator of cell morphogenesis and NO signaling
MQLESNLTVAEIAARSLAAVRLFEQRGIDYCCGGHRPLAEACNEKGIDPDTIKRELEAALAAGQQQECDWASVSLQELTDHIVGTHHEYLKRELPLLADRLAKVYRIYNERYGPTLVGLPEVYDGLRSELEMHMMKEERILFPNIAAAEQAVASSGMMPPLPFGSFANPIAMMEREHNSAGGALARIREITGNFALPDCACTTYRALMNGLQELEQDLHLHIHLENNILFPRTLELERKFR